MVKKTFPKIKKSLKGFLTDESGKVTKKDVLGISAGASAITGMNVELASACGEHVSSTSHSSGCSATSQSSISGYNSGGHVSRTLRSGSFSIKVPETPIHASGINISSHGSSTGANKTLYSGSHLSYSARGSYKSQPSITGYTHSSGSTHSSGIGHSNSGYECP